MLRYIDVPISLILRIRTLQCVINLLTHKDTIDRYGYLVSIVDIYLHSTKIKLKLIVVLKEEGRTLYRTRIRATVVQRKIQSNKRIRVRFTLLAAMGKLRPFAFARGTTIPCIVQLGIDNAAIFFKSPSAHSYLCEFICFFYWKVNK